MKLSGLLNMRGIGGQIAALVLVSLIALHALTTAVFLFHLPAPPPRDHGVTELVVAVRLLAASSQDERATLLEQLKRSFPELGLTQLPAGPLPSADDNASPVRMLQRQLGPDFRIAVTESDMRNSRVRIALPDGFSLSASARPDRRAPSFWSSPWFSTLVFGVIVVALLGLWAARTLAAPLSGFARAAEDFSLDREAAPLPERGPDEVRALAKSLNRMRARITALISDRTRMLAAISHDLRTPITRLRLRAEFVDDEVQRRRMLADIDQMQSMLESVLSFLRNDGRQEPMTLVDIASTLQLVADQFTDSGHAVSYAGPDHAMATVRPDDLLRSVTNIVENAVRFGSTVAIRLNVTGATATIDVEDDGPGISAAAKDAMLEPFVRGDEARNMDDAAGFGLGLSIARAIAQAHGGTLTLLDRQPHGLIVRIELPLGSRPRPPVQAASES